VRRISVEKYIRTILIKPFPKMRVEICLQGKLPVTLQQSHLYPDFKIKLIAWSEDLAEDLYIAIPEKEDIEIPAGNKMIFSICTTTMAVCLIEL
jgi:hypothetical protein